MKPPMPSDDPTRLPRTLGFWTLTAYGIGDILGAGIYAVTGKVAARAGDWSVASFSIAMGAAALTALSYAELSGRFPRSGGESYFCQQAFGSRAISLLVGWLVFCSGVVSMATACHAFRGYFAALLPPVDPRLIGLLPFLFLVVVAGINFWGMRQSSAANLVCTSIEVTGLLIVIAVGLAYLVNAAPPTEAAELARVSAAAAASDVSWIGVLQGGMIAFFAFIGFEDMVNVAEEVRQPERNLPRAILLALAVAGTLYLLVVIIAVRVVPPDEMRASSAPLLDVVRRAAPSFPPWIFSLIAMFAVANTALLNFVMGSRLLYGMSRQRLLPSSLSAVHDRTGTPHLAIICMLAVGLVLVAVGRLEALAGATSFLLLAVFTVVNVALLVVQRTDKSRFAGFRVPAVIPLAGGIVSITLAAFVPPESLPFVIALVACGAAAVAIRWFAARRHKKQPKTD